MAHGNPRFIALLLTCGLAVSANASTQPQPQAAFDGLGTTAKTTLVVATLIAVIAGIGVGVYFAARQGHTVKGCVADAGSGLQLETERGKNYMLLGASAGIKPGERIKVTGSRKKTVKGVTEKQSFIVDKLDRDYGACTVVLPHS